MKVKLMALKMAIIIIALLEPGKASSQEPEIIKTGFDSTGRDIFGKLDSKNITTGILYDKQMVPFCKIRNFGNVDTLSDTTQISDTTTFTIVDTVTVQNWKQMYYEMYNSFLSTPTIPTIFKLDSLAKTYKKQKIIPIAIMNFRYNEIKEDALEKGLLEIRDGQLYETPLAKAESPYVERTVFAATTFQDYSYSLNVQFILNQDFFQGNNVYSDDKIWIWFDDGCGWRKNLQLNQVISITYPSYGKKWIIVKVWRRLIGSSYYLRFICVFKFWVREASIPLESFVVHRTSSIPWGGTYPTYEMIGVYRPGGTSLEKPIIVVKGFDPANDNDYEEVWEMIDQQNLATKIRQLRYDLIFYNFDSGADYIQRNAMGLVDLIEWVNANKTSSEDIVIVAGSMGGLITRYALTYMERFNIPHHCRLFLSFDSPQQDANVPLGDQWFCYFFSDRSYLAQSAFNDLNTPAAKQMLAYHFYPWPNSLFTQFKNDLATIGNYPNASGLRKVAVSNGNGQSWAQMGYYSRMQPGSQIVNWNWENWEDVTGNVWAVPNISPLTRIFEGWIDWGGIPIKSLDVSVYGTKPYDNAPGGWRNSQEVIASGSTDGHGDITTNFPNHCFIPTVSALDLRDANGNPLNLFTYLPTATYTTPFDAIYYDINHENEGHIEITPGIANFVIGQLWPDLLDDFEYTDSPLSHHWTIYAGSGNVTTIYDATLNSRVMQTTTSVGTGFGIAFPKDYASNPLNLEKRYFSFKIKDTDDFIFSVTVLSTGGIEYFLEYHPTEKLLAYPSRRVAVFSLGSSYKDSNWHTVERDLEIDLYTAFKVHFKSVKWFCIRGDYYLDDLKLSNTPPKRIVVADF
ncbi:MAG: hypothetical protein AB1393_11425, partial [Candidatus Edwardsbacteria bacterium]